MRSVILKVTVACVMVCSSAALASRAQNVPVTPFGNLAVAFEAGVTGIGIEVATPLHRCLVLRTGLTVMPLNFNARFDIDYGDGDRSMDGLIASHPWLRDELRDRGLPVTSKDLPEDVDFTARFGLLRGKLLFDYYPFRRTTFHLTAGIYFNNGRLLSLRGSMPDQVTAVAGVIDGGVEEQYRTAINLSGHVISTDGDGRLDAEISAWRVNPYIGIGIGHAIPERRFGCQFDVGVMFHGKPAITSANASVMPVHGDGLESNGLVEALGNMTVYPVVSLKLIGRIF